jgi:hypothetical protein
MPRESRASATAGSVPPRWWQRALPLTALAVLATVAVVALGSGNEQIKLSTTRQEQPFVELGLTTAPQTLCGDKVVRFGYTVVSHLDTRETLTLRVTADPDRAGARSTTKQGELALSPDEKRALRVKLKAPRGKYDVTVSIADRPETIRVHCDGVAR